MLDAVAQHQAWIAGEVLATAFTVGDAGSGAAASGDDVHDLDIDGATVSVRMTKA